jgi:hypothetical protein
MLFCITANYTPNALNAMRENPTTDRKQAIEQLLKAAGGGFVLPKRYVTWSSFGFVLPKHGRALCGAIDRTPMRPFLADSSGTVATPLLCSGIASVPPREALRLTLVDSRGGEFGFVMPK